MAEFSRRHKNNRFQSAGLVFLVLFRPPPHNLIHRWNQKTYRLAATGRCNSQKVHAASSIHGIVRKRQFRPQKQRQTAHLHLSRHPVALRDQILRYPSRNTLCAAKLAKRLQRLWEELLLLLIILFRFLFRLLLLLALLLLHLLFLLFRKQGHF